MRASGGRKARSRKAAGFSKKQPSEHQEQAALIKWADLLALQYNDLRSLFAVPNGGLRAKATAAKLKAEGVRPGVPDLLLLVPAPSSSRFFGCSGLAIELKRAKGGRATKAQTEWLSRLERNGFAVVVAHGWRHAADAIEDYLELNTPERAARYLDVRVAGAHVRRGREG
jgi:hypothetical protein